MGMLDTLFPAYANGPGMSPIEPPPLGAKPETPSAARKAEMGWLASLMQRPSTPGFSGEPADNSTGGWLRPGALWGAADAPKPDASSGVEPSEVWSKGTPTMAPPLPPPVTIGGAAGAQQPGEAYAAAPAMTTPRPAAGPPVASAAPATPGFGARLSSMLGRNSNMLMAMGAGMMGAPTLGQGMSRGFAAAIPASAQDTKQALQQSSISESYKALRAAGASPADALAAVYNPDVMKAITPRIFGKAMEWKVVKEHPNGTKEYGFVDGANASLVRGSEVTKPRVSTMEEALHLPRGTHFIDPEGVERVR